MPAASPHVIMHDVEGDDIFEPFQPAHDQAAVSPRTRQTHVQMVPIRLGQEWSTTVGCRRMRNMEIRKCVVNISSLEIFRSILKRTISCPLQGDRHFDLSTRRSLHESALSQRGGEGRGLDTERVLPRRLEVNYELPYVARAGSRGTPEIRGTFPFVPSGQAEKMGPLVLTTEGQSGSAEESSAPK